MTKVKVSKFKLIVALGYKVNWNSLPDFIEVEAEVVEEKCEHTWKKMCPKCGLGETSPAPIKELKYDFAMYGLTREVTNKINEIIRAINTLRK